MAIDAKIEEQHKFVAWWTANVSPGHGGNRKSKDQVPGTRYLKFQEAEALTGMAQQRVSDLGRWLKKLDKYREHLLGAEYRAAMLETADNVRGTQGTGENEWFTPPDLLDRARRVLGDFDLDPASHPAAQRQVMAAEFFTKDDDGLAKNWHGRVWLNPPYAQPHIANFVQKMIAEIGAGRVTAAIMLTHNYTDTAWFQNAAAIAEAICFTRGRVRFIDINNAIAAPTTRSRGRKCPWEIQY
jgi:phage N-6-adenine-methyltransferase